MTRTCEYCDAVIGFGSTRCNTETCYLAEIGRLKQKLAASELENKAWRALATHRVAGYGSEMTSFGKEGTDGHGFVFSAEHRGTGNWHEASRVAPQAAAIDLATKLGLLEKAGG